MLKVHRISFVPIPQSTIIRLKVNFSYFMRTGSRLAEKHFWNEEMGPQIATENLYRRRQITQITHKLLGASKG